MISTPVDAKSKTNRQQGGRIFVVSPYAAHPGHHWKYAEQIALALKNEGRCVTLFIHDTIARTPAPEIVASLQTSPRAWQHVIGPVLSSLAKFPAARVLHQPLETFGVLLAVSRSLRKNRDVEVIHFIDATFLVFLLWEFFSCERCVYNLMGNSEPLNVPKILPNPFHWLKRAVTRWLLAACLRRGLLEFCAETEAIRSDWSKIAGGHVHVIPYAISPLENPVLQTRARADLGIKQAETVFLLYGTHRFDKDFATVIRAASRLSPSPLLLFVGKHISGPSPSVLLCELGFTNYLIFDRFVAEAEVAVHFAACDAVLLPYNEGYEKGSGVLIEACQYLKPVIATDTGYLRNFVQHHQIGWLFRFGDPNDLAHCMKAVVDLSLEKRTALQAALLAAATAHSWPRIIQDYLALYRKLREHANC